MREIRQHRICTQTAAELLQRMQKVRVGLVGDVCLDAYWEADMRQSSLSRETPHHPLPIVAERYSPGGGGNVAANLAALQLHTVRVCTILGNDWRGSLLSGKLAELQMDTSGVVYTDEWLTAAYCKPIRGGISDVRYEDPRIDFENRNPPPHEAEKRLYAAIMGLRGQVDAIAITEQFRYSCITEPVRQALCELAEEIPIIVDSRERAHLYRNAIVKPNEHEASHLFGVEVDGSDVQALARAAEQISVKTCAAAIITLGEHGSFCHSDKDYAYLPAFPCEPPLDIVGAGDTFLSAVAAAAGAGASLADAVAMGNAASAVTVKKCGTTGVASPEEILAVIRKEEA